METFLLIALILIFIFLNKKKSKSEKLDINKTTLMSKQTNNGYDNKFNRRKNYGKYVSNKSVTSLIDGNEEIITTALVSNRKIQFNYEDRNKARTSRIVNPIRLFTYYFDDEGEMLCLEAFCHLRKANRTFALFRMSSVTTI